MVTKLCEGLAGKLGFTLRRARETGVSEKLEELEQKAKVL